MSNAGFIITMCIMLLVIILLSGSLQGCTKLQTRGETSKDWSISVRGRPEECTILLIQDEGTLNMDDSIEFEQPTKPM